MGWGVNSRGGEGNPIIWLDFCRKLYENERIWTGGGVHPWRALGSANVYCIVENLARFTICAFSSDHLVEVESQVIL